jgi:hypothetical protein
MNTIAAAAHAPQFRFGPILLVILVLGALGFGALRFGTLRLGRRVRRTDQGSPEVAVPRPEPAPAAARSTS